VPLRPVRSRGLPGCSVPVWCGLSGERQPKRVNSAETRSRPKLSPRVKSASDGAEAMRAASARESWGTLRLARGVVLHSRLYLGWMRAAVESIAEAIYAQGI